MSSKPGQKQKTAPKTRKSRGAAQRLNKRSALGEHPAPLAGEDYRKIYLRAPDAILVVDAEGRYIDANPAAEVLTGYSREELLTKRVGDLTTPDQRNLSTERFSLLRSTGRSRRDRMLLRKDGATIPVDAHAVHLGDGTYLTMVRDISEQRRVVEQLNDALQRLNFHLERMPLAYIVWDTDFRVLQWNPAAEKIFGYTREEALAKHAYELVVPPDVQPTVNKVWADLLAGDTSSHSINANVRKNGSRLTCEWLSTPLLDAAGQVRCVASMAMDITEREIVESRIRDAQKLESLGLLAGGVAHDFNSSLMVILGNTSLLRALKGLPNRALQYLELIEESGLRASDLIKHLLAYARTGRHNPQLTDLNTVINEAMLFVRSSIGKLHEVVVKLTKPLPPILADRSQVDQIIVNLCVNAMQAMPDGGTIELSTGTATLTRDCLRNCVPFDAEAGEYVELLASDTGCGMDAETVSRIFDPFFTTKAEGHGLGLAAVLGILRQHRAAACVESKVGKGTKFHIYFPLYRTEGSNGQRSAAEDRKRNHQSPPYKSFRKRGK